jgi:two-component system sensor histidine kinase YesM
MALLPLVENALVHGVEKIEGMGMVRIATRAGEKEVAIDICDNGPGADAGLIERLRSGECLSQGTKKHCSSGLSGLLERLTLIYGAAYRLELDRTDDGLFRVRLTVPRGGAPA